MEKLLTIYQITFIRVLGKQNNNPQDFNNVMAYVSDPWSDPFQGCLENLELTPGNGNLEFKICYI